MIKKFLQNHPIHNRIVPLFDVIFLLRPTIFFAVWIMVVVGIISAEQSKHIASLWHTDISWKIFFVFLGLTSVISSIFITKQIHDAKNANDIQELSLVGKHISSVQAESIARILLISGSFISIISSWITAIPVLCIYLICRSQYNQVSILSWLLNTCVGMLLFIVGWMLGMENSQNNEIIPLSFNTFSHMLPYVLSFSAISLMTILYSLQSNVGSDTQTIPFGIGFSTSLIIAVFMVSIAFFISIRLIDPLASTATLVSLPFFLFSAFRRLNKDMLRAIRYPIFIINFFALSYYPWLVVPLLFTYYLSKYYYWHRFDLHYPTFLVDND